MAAEERENVSVSPNTTARVWNGILAGYDTRSGLAQGLEMNKMTVGRAVRLLLSEGLLTERRERTRRGNPVMRLRADETRCYLILSLGSEGNEAILVTPAGREVLRLSFSEDDPMELPDRVDSCLGRTVGMMRLWGRAEHVSNVALLLKHGAEPLKAALDRFDAIYYGDEKEIPSICRSLNQKTIALIFNGKLRENIDKALT